MSRPHLEFTSQIIPYIDNGSVVSNETYYPYYRTYASVKTPNYKRIKRGNLPMNGYHMQKSTLTTGLATMKTWQNSSMTNLLRSISRCWYGDYGGYLADPTHIAASDSLAISRLASQVSSIKVNSAQAFAERRQTVNLIEDTAVRIARAAHALKRGNVRGVEDALRIKTKANLSRDIVRDSNRLRGDEMLANYWLSYQYGWQPLLQDLYGHAKLLADRIKTRQYVARISSTASQLDNGTIKFNFGYNTQVRTIGYFTRKTRTKYVVNYGLADDAKVILGETGISNPALLAWELLPWSFVVDWFLPVGNYLEALRAYDGFVFKSGTKSQFTRVENDVNFNVLVTGTGYFGPLCTGAGYYKVDRYDRTVLSDFPRPNFPSFRNPVSVTHGLNAIALLRSTFKVR